MLAYAFTDVSKGASFCFSRPSFGVCEPCPKLMCLAIMYKSQILLCLALFWKQVSTALGAHDGGPGRQILFFHAKTMAKRFSWYRMVSGEASERFSVPDLIVLTLIFTFVLHKERERECTLILPYPLLETVSSPLRICSSATPPTWITLFLGLSVVNIKQECRAFRHSFHSFLALGMCVIR